MRLGYFTMPMHPLNPDYTTTLKQDRKTIILCDALGYHDAFVGEHLTDMAENISNSMLFLATLIHATDNIILRTDTSNLTHTHPGHIATNAAMFDHMSEDRSILAVSPGTRMLDREILGILDEDINKMFADSVDVIMAIWDRDAPYKIDFPNNRWTVTAEQSFDPAHGTGIMPKPYQKTHQEIVGTEVAPFSKGVIEMGKRGFHPISANFLIDKWVASHWDNYVQGCKTAGQPADPAHWRVAHTVFVNDDHAIAKAYGNTDERSTYRFYYGQPLCKLPKYGLPGVFKRERNELNDTLTIDRIVDDLVICGDVESVMEQLLAFRETIGPFGDLIIAGIDWVDEGLSKRSLQLMAV